MFDTLIVHGSFGTPYENWFPWLANSLGERGHRAVVPHFPDEECQNLDNWVKVLDSYSTCLADDLYVFAHSLAPAFVVDYCISRTRPVQKAVFVSPFYGLIGIDEFDNVNRTFFIDSEYLDKFKFLCKETVCIFSDDDPYVPRPLFDDFARRVGAITHVIPGGKHLNTSAGFREFPLLLSV